MRLILTVKEFFIFFLKKVLLGKTCRKKGLVVLFIADAEFFHFIAGGIDPQLLCFHLEAKIL